MGASSAMAEQCARLWVGEGAVDLTLVGRNLDRLQRMAADLSVRSPQSQIRVMQSGFIEPAEIARTVRQINEHGPVDVVLIAHGALPEQAQAQADLALCREMLEVNGVSPVLFAEAFAGHMAQAGSGTLALIGSVAGDRGRKSNYIYGAAKGLVTRYAEGLQHRFAGTAVKVVLIKPGPTRTPMTAHLAQQGLKMASVKTVARTIVAAVQAGRPVAYVPGKWALIMLIIRHLPRWVFSRLNI